MTQASITKFGTFRIEIRPSPDTNDHQVRFIADGIDVIDTFCAGSIGLDPDDLLLSGSLTPTAPESLTLVARCDCGVIGCGDINVTIARVGDFVLWQLEPSSGSGPVLQFPATAYLHEVERAATDTSWETPDRTAARLFRESADHELLASRHLRVQWASGRVRDGVFTLSLELSPGPYQLLIHIPWRGQSPVEIAAEANRAVAAPPESWPEVQYLPQRPNLPRPGIAGPGWSSAT